MVWTDNRQAKKIYEWIQKCQRKREIPQLTWTNGIPQTVRERGLEDGVWEDRDGWRVTIKS